VRVWGVGTGLRDGVIRAGVRVGLRVGETEAVEDAVGITTKAESEATGSI